MNDPKGWLSVIEVQDGERGGARHLLSALTPERALEAGVPSEAILGELVDGPERLVPESFRPNPVFARFLHWVIARHAASSPGLTAEARRQRDGFVYVIDQRTPTPQGPVPPEDLLGGFEVKGGVVVRYHASPNHRLLTHNGPLRLDPWYQAKLLEELNILAAKK